MFNVFLHNYDSENPNLKPCPFCGNNPVWHLQDWRLFSYSWARRESKNKNQLVTYKNNNYGTKMVKNIREITKKS